MSKRPGRPPVFFFFSSSSFFIRVPRWLHPLSFYIVRFASFRVYSNIKIFFPTIFGECVFERLREIDKYCKIDRSFGRINLKFGELNDFEKTICRFDPTRFNRI